MKKKIVIISLSIILVIGLLIMITKNNKKVYTDIDGIKYAILVNGTSATSFPTGNYKVDISCTNADAYWNSITSKVIIKNIKGNITCDISFNSITSSDYLNTYLTSLSGTTQGEGQMVHEIGYLPDYNSTSVVTSYGTTPAYFYNTDPSYINQTNVDNYWTFSNGTFTSVPSTFSFSGFSSYHVYAQIPEDGYYRICYTIAKSSSTYNSLYIYKNTTYLTSISSSKSAQVGEACYYIGYLNMTDYINVSEYAYSGTSSPVMTFRLEKDNNPISVDTGYRYEGFNPNNYIMFNNELWRIIGVFETEYDSDNNGTIDTTANLVKITRDESIGGLAWDKSNTNDWSNSSLYHLLNYEYYDWNTNKATVDTYCYSYSTTIPRKCDFSIKGIQDGYRGMIVKAKWYLGGFGKSNYTYDRPEFIYSYERDANAIYSGRSASTLGYVGLMYESDYLYGVLASDCERLKSYVSYNDNCVDKDWLYSGIYEWTISPVSSNENNVWSLTYIGSIQNYYSANYGLGVRPVLYLSSSVYKVGGTGTITDPYIIGLSSS